MISCELLITILIFFFFWIQVLGVLGTVKGVSGSLINVEFKNSEGESNECLDFNPTILKKLDKFYVGQVLQIRSDEIVARQMRNVFSHEMCLKVGLYILNYHFL